MRSDLVISAVQGNLAEQPADALVVNLFEGVAEPGGAAGAIDRALDGAISGLIANGDFAGQIGTTATLYPRRALPAPRVIIAGLGPRAALSQEAVRRASGMAIQTARDLGARRVASVVHGAGAGGLDPESAAQAVVEGALLAAYQFRRPEREVPAALTLVEFDAGRLPAVEAGARAGRAIGESVNFARDLVNQPPNVCTPESMARQAAAMAREVGLACTILGPDQLLELNMGALLAVAAASPLPPRLIVLEHRPAEGAALEPIVLVGKGITFDSGGLSIKPAADMPAMKDDMGGGAAVLGALRAAAALKLSRPVVGLVPAAENVVSGAGFRPSDVITAGDGTTIEIISTDAEGRLILADALVYARRYEPAALIDVATLTGACVVALGQGIAAGLFTNHSDLAEWLRAAAERSGERLWPLPLYPDYREQLESDVADLRNSSGDRFGGVGVSAAFLQAFAGPGPWAHIDMAGLAMAKKARAPWPRGATGFGVRLLVEFLRDRAGPR